MIHLTGMYEDQALWLVWQFVPDLNAACVVIERTKQQVSYWQKEFHLLYSRETGLFDVLCKAVLRDDSR